MSENGRGAKREYTQDTELSTEPSQNSVLRPEQVRDYLLNNPDFFMFDSDVLEVLRIPHQQKGTVSLVERQAEQLRISVKQLKAQIHDLMSVAKQNERIYRIYADLNLRLFSCRNLADVRTHLEQVLLHQLDLKCLSLKLFGSEHDIPQNQKSQLLQKRFRDQIYYLGRINQDEQSWLFANQDVESVAMMLLGERGEMGLLAIGSSESHHFHPGMDTLLITQLQKFLTLVVPQLAEY